MDQSKADPASCFDDQLCFVAYTLTHAFTRRYRAAFGGTGMTYPRYLAVTALARLDNPTMTELARHLRMEHGTLTPMIKLLERDGVVVRERKDADERVVRVQLTDHGQELLRRCEEAMQDVRGATGKSAKALSALVTELIAIRTSLDAASDAIESG